jgi:hypothetical protein
VVPLLWKVPGRMLSIPPITLAPAWLQPICC